MILVYKGYIEEYASRDQIKVRIPSLHGIKDEVGSLTTDELPNCSICSLPNCQYELSKDDVVFVTFERYNYGMPIIIGFLDIKSNSQSDIQLREVEVNNKTVLPINTSIGEVSADSINCLKDLDVNINDYIKSTNPTYILDLTEYSSGDTIPVSILNAIPDNAFIYCKAFGGYGVERYFPLIEKTTIHIDEVTTYDNMEEYPKYNYVFGSILGIVRITGGIYNVD